MQGPDKMVIQAHSANLAREVIVLVGFILFMFSTCRLYGERQKPTNRTRCLDFKYFNYEILLSFLFPFVNINHPLPIPSLFFYFSDPDGHSVTYAMLNKFVNSW